MPRLLLKEATRPGIWETIAISLSLAGSALASQFFFSFPDSGFHLLWLPTGLAVGLLLRVRLRVLPGVLLGLLFATLIENPEHLVPDLLRAYAECFFALFLLRRKYFDPEFSFARDVGVFAGCGAILTPILAMGAYFSCLQFMGLPVDQDTGAWLELFSRMTAIGLCVPAITLFNAREWLEMPRSTRWKLLTFILLGPAAIEAELVYSQHAHTQAHPFALLPFPLIAWIVISTSVSAAMQFLLLMSLILICAAVRGLGYFASPDALRTALTMDGFISLLCLSTLTMGTLLRHRNRLETLTRGALRGAQIAIWEWRPGKGLIIYDEEWAQHFRSRAGQPIDMHALEGAIESLEPVSILTGAHEVPDLKEYEEEQFRLHLPDGTWRQLQCRRLPSPPASAALRNTMNGILMDLTETKEAEALRQKTLLSEAELKNLKLSIHPHFLFNSLNSLRSLIASRPNEARECVTQLAAFLRSSLGASEENLVRFGAELDLVKNYLAIEQLRFGKRLRQNITIAAGSEGIAFPPMLLQTLVENALKYGVSRRMEGGELKLESELTDKELVVRVINEGSLIPTPSTATGTGLQAANQRLYILYGSKASLTLKQVDGPLVVAEIRIPKSEKDILPSRNNSRSPLPQLARRA